MRLEMKIRLTVFLLTGILLMLFSHTAMASNETVEVHIPVWAGWTDCTAELLDAGGNRVQLLELKRTVTNEFVFQCTGLMRFAYRIRLIDEDNREFRFDHTIYQVYVDVFKRDDEEPFYTVTVARLGVLDPDDPKKQDAIQFFNKPRRPTVPFPTLPETGYSGTGTELQERIGQNLTYGHTGWTLQIPALSLITDIVTVPVGEKNYDVSLLEGRAGLLEGFEMPGEGYSLITGHDHLNQTEAGPFACLWEMEIGDRVFVLDEEDHIQIFEVYANEKIAADDVEGLADIADDWERSLTFITCEDERIEGGYANRRIVAAKPIN